MSLKIIVPDPSINTPVPLLVPSPATEITFVQTYALVLDLAGLVNGTKALLLLLSKHCCTLLITGATNLIRAPLVTNLNSVVENVPTLYGVDGSGAAPPMYPVH